MPVHVAILKSRYIQLILAGTKTMESRLTQTRLAPYLQVQTGDRIYFKCSGGPYMAKALAGQVKFHDQLTPVKVRQLALTYNQRVCGQEAYWQQKERSLYGTLIVLDQVEPCHRGPIIEPSCGLAWFVLEEALMPTTYEITFTDGAVRNRYIQLPGPPLVVDPRYYAKAGKPGDPLTFVLPDGKIVQCDIVNDRLRCRRWSKYIHQYHLAEGDRVIFEQLSHDRFALSFAKA